MDAGKGSAEDGTFDTNFNYSAYFLSKGIEVTDCSEHGGKFTLKSLTSDKTLDVKIYAYYRCPWSCTYIMIDKNHIKTLEKVLEMLNE